MAAAVAATSALIKRTHVKGAAKVVIFMLCAMAAPRSLEYVYIANEKRIQSKTTTKNGLRRVNAKVIISSVAVTIKSQPSVCVA